MTRQEDIAYEPTPALDALGTYSQWWSDGDSERPIGEVLDAIQRRPEWADSRHPLHQ